MHFRCWAVRSSRGLSQCLDSGLPIKHEPISFMRWQGLDPTPASWDFLSVAATALMAGVGWVFFFHIRFSGAFELLYFVTPSWRQASSLVSFCRDDRRLPLFPWGWDISTGALLVDRGMTGTVRVRQLPGRDHLDL